MRRLAILAAGVAAAVGLSARPATAQTQVTCESVNGRQNVCAMDTRGGVQLVKYLSLTPCREGQNWGLARGGIWVSGGCRGVFSTVGVASGSGRYNNGNTYDPWGRNNDRTYDNGSTWSNDQLNVANRLCRQAIRQRFGNRGLQTQVRDSNRNTVRLDWATGSGHSGTCRVNRNGNVSVNMAR